MGEANFSTFDDARRALWRVTQESAIEWLRRGGIVTIAAAAPPQTEPEAPVTRARSLSYRLSRSLELASDGLCEGCGRSSDASFIRPQTTPFADFGRPKRTRRVNSQLGPFRDSAQLTARLLLVATATVDRTDPLLPGAGSKLTSIWLNQLSRW